MSTYKKEVGTSVQNFAGNYPGAVEGQLWYDSTNKDFKYQYTNVTTAGSWATGGNMNTARQYLGPSSSGTQTASLGFGGDEGASFSALTESYDGTTWTEVNDLNTARGRLGGAGTQTSALGFGGTDNTTSIIGLTESWNGTSWTEVNDLNTARAQLGSTGTQPSALAFGGEIAPSNVANTESWNGTSWTEVNDLNLSLIHI